jgi:hypothetical protein
VGLRHPSKILDPADVAGLWQVDKLLWAVLQIGRLPGLKRLAWAAAARAGAVVASVGAALIACTIWLSPAFAAVRRRDHGVAGFRLYLSESANIARQRRRRGRIDLDEE